MKGLHVVSEVPGEDKGFMWDGCSTSCKWLQMGMRVASHGNASVQNWFGSKRFPQVVVGSSKSNSLSINRAFVCQIFYGEPKTLLAGVTMKERLRGVGVLGFHVCHPFSLNKLGCHRFGSCYLLTMVNDFKLACSPPCSETRWLGMHNTAKWIYTRGLN